MGQSSSSNRAEKNWEREASINFHKRIKAYNYAYHGPYSYYVECCQAQYQLECIPDYCRQGSGYRAQYDHYGRQVY
jgi:hypothetical protein